MLQKFVLELEGKIKAAYEEGTTQPDAERLAAEFLHAQMVISSHLRKADLDARMRKSGHKAIRAAVYMGEVGKSEKKPSDTLCGVYVKHPEQPKCSEQASKCLHRSPRGGMRGAVG